MARLFDGVSGGGSVALDLSRTNRAAVSVWLYWDAFANNNAVAVEFAAAANWLADTGFVIRPNDTGTTQFGVRQGNAGTQNGGAFTRPSAGEWHHLLVVFDRNLAASSKIVAYLDGALQSTTFDQLGTFTTNFGATTLRIMRSAAGQYGPGRASDIAIWEAALPGAQDAAKMAAGRRPNDRSLSVQPSFHWPMVSGSGAPALQGRAIAWSGTTSPAADPARLDPYRSTRGPVWAPGTLMAAALAGAGAAGGAGVTPPSSSEDAARWRNSHRTRYRW